MRFCNIDADVRPLAANWGTAGGALRQGFDSQLDVNLVNAIQGGPRMRRVWEARCQVEHLWHLMAKEWA
jgi:hypothetical protein